MKKITWDKIRRRIWFDPKVKGDRIAFSFLKHCKNVVDVGCGPGRFIAQDKYRIVGLDWSDASLDKCRSKGYNVIKADARHLPFGNNSVEGIHCSHLIEHLEPSDVHKMLSEFDRILTPKVTLIIRAPLLWKGFYSNLTHVKPYNPEAILHYLTPSRGHTFSQISEGYRILYLKKRFGHIDSRNIIINILTRLGFPWLEKTGYMLVLQKGE